MSKVEERIKALGLELPECPTPVAAYVPATKAANLIFAAGQTGTVNGKLQYVGKVGAEVSDEEAYESAKQAALRCIAEIKSVAKDLDKVKILKVVGYVNAVPDFGKHPKIVNGASELINAVFGDKGHHARVAFGCGSLPDCAPVEIDIIAIEED